MIESIWVKASKVIFLIEYSRIEGRLVCLQTFEDSERRRAENARLEIELDLNRRGIDHEVVILEAEDEEAIRKTHGRYFKTVEQLIETSDIGR